MTALILSLFTTSAHAEDYLILAKSGQLDAAVTAAELLGGEVARIEALDAFTVSLDPADLDSLLAERSVADGGEDGFFAAAEPTLIEAVADHDITGVTADDEPMRDLQWMLDAIDADRAWAAGYTGAGVRVCVLDEGIDSDHEDLVDNVNTELSVSMVPFETVEADQIEGPYFNHGTHVAATIAAADNGKGIMGVAPDAEIVAIKVLSESYGYGAWSWILQGLVYAAEIDCDVINMSLGGIADRSFGKGSHFASAVLTAQQRAIAHAHQQGSLVVVAAGNDAFDMDQEGQAVVLPAGLPHTVTVSAMGPSGLGLDPDADLWEQASYTNTGSAIDIGAPGGNFSLEVWLGGEVCQVGDVTLPCYLADLVISAGVDDSYYFAQGTSMATPHVSGVAALLFEQLGDKASPNTVRTALLGGAEDLGKSGGDDVYGRGALNAAEALE